MMSVFPDLMPGKHLLFDNASVADTFRLKRRLHQPKRDPEQPVLVAEKPWEGAGVTPLHVVFDCGQNHPGKGDPERGHYRMWYQIHDPKLAEERKKLGRSKYGNVGEPQPIYCCYAESRDGVKWDRPSLGIYKHPAGDHRQGGAGNNICFKGFSYVAGNTFLHRPDAPPNERWLMVNCEWVSDQKGGIYIAYGPDGIHWKYPSDEPLIFGESDTWNCIVYNPERKVYMIYMRGWHCAAVNWPILKKPNQRRRVAYSESKDLKNWSEPQVILTPDEMDTNDFYGFQVFRHADYYLGQLWIYDDDVAETIEIELAWSHDGIHWSRLPDRQKFLRRGRPGEPDGYLVIPAQEPVVVGNEIQVYFTGHPQPHGAEHASSVGYRAKLRLDGFLSLDAGLPHGALITRPFVLQNNAIEINAAVHFGEITAELCEPYYHEPEGKPIAGFTAKDFDVFRGDSIAHKLSWRGNSDLNNLKCRRLMLRLLMQRAEMYSFTL